jgi:hypothetical protein
VAAGGLHGGAVEMKYEPQRRSKPISARSHRQLAPLCRADWLPPENWRETMDRRVQRHQKAEKKLAADPLLGRLVPLFRILYQPFWDWAIDDARGKGLAAAGKRIMRNKGRNVVLFRSHGLDAQPYRDSLPPLQEILGSLRANGRPSIAPFHDTVAACCQLAYVEHSGQFVRWPQALRRFLELPELGYELPAGRMRRIFSNVIGKVANGGAPEIYPNTAAVFKEMKQTQATRTHSRRGKFI